MCEMSFIYTSLNVKQNNEGMEGRLCESCKCWHSLHVSPPHNHGFTTSTNVFYKRRHSEPATSCCIRRERTHNIFAIVCFQCKDECVCSVIVYVCTSIPAGDRRAKMALHQALFYSL